jgi:hypothetical protein
LLQSKKVEAKSKKILCESMRNEAKKKFLISQKQAKMKQNKMCFASFCFEAKIKKERERDTLYRPLKKVL